MNDVILLYKYVHSTAVLADVRACETNHCVSVNKFVIERNAEDINPCHRAFVFVFSEYLIAV